MKIVIIGGVAAGAKAAAKSKRLCPNSDVDIFTQEKYVSYSACGLPYFIQGNFTDYRKLVIRTPEKFAQDGVNVHLQQKVTKIFPDKKQIVVLDLITKRENIVPYDKLVIATGATPFIPQIKNVNLKNIFTLRTLEDGIKIKEKLNSSKKAVILGGGYIGIELLEAFVSNNVHTTLIEKSNKVMSVLDDEISAMVQDYIESYLPEYTRIINNTFVTEFIGDDKVTGVKIVDGSIIETDFVLLATGIRPLVSIAKDAGIKLGVTGAIKVNSRMETNIEDIYACGDCIEEVYVNTGISAWIPLGSTANKEGRCAAMNLCGIVDDFKGVLGSAVTKYFDMTISRTGLTEKFARKNGFDVETIVITRKDKAGYMPNTESVTLKLIANKRTHHLIGAQAIGKGDADKRINTLATAIFNAMKIEDLAESDITYSPPFSTSIDPVITAANLLSARLNKTE